MTCPNDNSNFNAAIELLTANGLEGLSDVMSILINEAMKLQRRDHLNAEPYERTEHRQGYANGFKPKVLKSRLGKLNLQVPQVKRLELLPRCY